MFKDIDRYPGYKVNENSIVINKNGHIMQPGISNNGRLRVTLETYDENGKLVKRTNEYIYRLSAEAFLPNPNNFPLVMHKDNDIYHNHISNLEWGNQSQNILQAYNEGRKVSPNKNNHDKYIYEVSNDDKSEIIKCKGCEGVAELLRFESPKSVRPGIVKSGQYKNYTVSNTGIKCKCPISFNK